MHQQVREVHQLAHGAAAVQPRLREPWRSRRCHSRDIPAVSGLDQDGRNLVVAKNTDNATHGITPSLSTAFSSAQLAPSAGRRALFVDLIWRGNGQIAPAGTSLVMTEPEPVIASSPTFTGATSMVFDPMKTSLANGRCGV